MHLIFHRDRRRPKMYPKLRVDILSSKGDWLLSLPIEKLGFTHYGTMGMDMNGGYFVNHRKPFSRVTKYKLVIKEIEARQ